MTAPLPPQIEEWFSARGWSIHPHQRDMLELAGEPCQLLIAPTGGGKTMAGFLPTLAELADGTHEGVHTLYISPLKALAADIKRNLSGPVAEMGLPIRIEDRTGDTPASRKRRQRADPPHILLTTPESLALLTSYEDAGRTFKGLKRVIVDEIHALSESKRGDQLMLALSRLSVLAPGLRRVGLSATVEDPHAVARILAKHPDPCAVLQADPGPDPDIAMLSTDVPPPWSGGGGRYAMDAVLEQVKAHKTTLIFHNTRAQAEIFFHNLWLANDEQTPIGIHHGALSREQRERVEAAMVAGQLRAIVCTGSLDLGLDWGDVDLVIQVGAPKNVKRLVQRIGRANHCYNVPSKALIVPANRFEVIECVAALQAVRARTLDGDTDHTGPLDVLCQHILIRACAGPFTADALFAEVTTAGAYSDLSREAFERCLDFAATGGYALRAYDQWQRLIEKDGEYRLRDPRATTRIRMNIGTIIDSEKMPVRMKKNRGGKPLGEVEEYFASTLRPGDTFLIGGKIVRFEGLREMTVEVSRTAQKKPRIATFSGTKFATSTQLSDRILTMFRQDDWPELPGHTREWLHLQRQYSQLPEKDRLLVETFAHDDRAYTVAYGFAGRNAQQTLGLLLTHRMETLGLHPLGFVATDYATMIWGLDEVIDPKPLFSRDTLMSSMENWLADTSVMKKTFKGSAVIAGLVDRMAPNGKRKTGRQAAFSTDILYDTLRKYDPDHIMLYITRTEAMRGLVDFSRIEGMLERVAGRIDHCRLDRVSPLAAPMMLEMGRVSVSGAANERLLEEETERLMQTAGLAFGSNP
ncbi:ligase-associated DNA damage response DEXH box helicase [Gymnodinialimonas sp. 57CJ19]|uniref:ligase-associated DNA damage response DEXH box helicase n=1 Tax=Gymnodinialimonas sp. 57CJ19 TaxID=3138498 RepID=UPI0031342CED